MHVRSILYFFFSQIISRRIDVLIISKCLSRSETNIHVHTNESNTNALSYFNGICYIKFAKLRDTRLDFYRFGVYSSHINFKFFFRTSITPKLYFIFSGK